MKFLILASLLFSVSARAYHSGTAGNRPVKEPVIKTDTRLPASTVSKPKK